MEQVAAFALLYRR